MNWTSVSSSNLDAVAYDDSTSTLFVRFNNGGEYSYANVPQSKYAGLLSASSHGSYFDAHIKKGGYSYRKL
ncbi:KTSC domain-containing protein [Paenibacillus sp. F6_3S_P_1C]|uniref:KTSC domain-containing protein n=1 Tax=Paenibacillus vandeheii TaxID=3035917 RepID=A0ABT8J535_9BACL|nr:KTSC domain-containing protein [Paenibacillus vandeheii]MDN4600028.1 KTSC domain-containing protein [Paenibacillus vandeheii]